MNVFLKTVLRKVNEASQRECKSADKNLKCYEKELKQLENRKATLFKGFEDGIISSEEFIMRKNVLTEEEEQLRTRLAEQENILAQEHRKEIPYEVIKNILQNFGKVIMDEHIERGLKKQLLHMLIEEITIDRRKEIESIHIKLTDALIELLQNTEGTSIEGVPSNYMLSKIGVSALDLKLAI